MEGQDEMDSLFEGMVLFTPSHLEDSHDPTPNAPPPTSHVDTDNNSIPTATASTTGALDKTPSFNHEEPLDENLFSDLTLQQPPLPPSPPPPATTTTEAATTTTAVSRQISRKKKRASGLRIGYARDDLSPPLSTSSITQPPSSDGDEIEDENRSTVTQPPSSDGDGIEDENVSSLTQPPYPDGDGIEDDNATSSVSSSSSILSQFDHVKSRISEKLNVTRDLASSLSALRKDSINTRRKAASDLQLASSEHRDLELELESAIAAEDFEAAERISESLAAVESERQRFLVAARDAEARCDAIDGQLQDFLDRQIEAELECSSLLYGFSKDAENEADLVFKKTEEVSSKETDDWFLSSEELEAKKIELDIESRFINEANLTVNDSIEHIIENDKKEKEILCKKKDVLNDELEKLLALVKEKEKEIAQNDAKIEEVEKRIADVVSSFQEVQASIGVKNDNLQSRLSQMNMKSEALSAKRTEIDKFVSEQEEYMAKIRQLARISEEEAKEYQEVVELRKSLKSSILKSREEKEMLAKTEEKLIEEVQILQNQASAARASLQELSSTKSSIQQTISSLKQKTFYIDKRIPELEAEKRVAATARNFKEAARIASESKSLMVEKDNLQSDLEKATSDLKKLEEDIENTVTRLQDIEGLILSKEKEVAMIRYQSLLIIAGAATAERKAALELSDDEEASLLLVEAEAARAEAKKIQDIYNFKVEDFGNLPKQFISIGVVSKLGRKQLAELAASAESSAS